MAEPDRMVAGGETLLAPCTPGGGGGGGGGVMPYMCHTETCRRSGYTFWPSNPRQGVFFELDSKTGCQICSITPSRDSETGCLFTVLFGTLPLVLTYLSFVQEINPSFDVFNTFIVII